jgi:hypothetical protein
MRCLVQASSYPNFLTLPEKIQTAGAEFVLPFKITARDEGFARQVDGIVMVLAILHTSATLGR